MRFGTSFIVVSVTSSAIVHCQTEAPSDWLISVLKFGSVSQSMAPASQQNKRAKGLLGAIGAVKLLAFDAIEKLSGTHFP